MKKILIFLLAILIIAGGCVQKTNNHPSYVELDGKIIHVEIAQTPEQRARGLMYREELCNECGMLFVFEIEEYRAFWMKNTLIPLDMIFINSDNQVVDVIHANPCTQDPCKSYKSKDKAIYVLETNQGIFNNQTIGKKVNIFISET